MSNISMKNNNRISEYDILLDKNKNESLFFYLLKESNLIYIDSNTLHLQTAAI